MSAIIVKHLCAQLASNTAVEIINHLDCDLFFEGSVADIPPELLFLDVVKFQTQNNRYILFVS